ncbi:hypothetical protein CFP56_024378 [Quercus suber]|uniref:Uncharacterized protein n=1 Tax=Quercus suber TaxID=58331 RepID=A0AAW0MCT2_QUESU
MRARIYTGILLSSAAEIRDTRYAISVASLLLAWHAIVSSSGDSANDVAVLHGLRVPFLDRNWVAQRVLPIRRELPGRFAATCGNCLFLGKVEENGGGF